jgi:hypothetical protein
LRIIVADPIPRQSEEVVRDEPRVGFFSPEPADGFTEGTLIAEIGEANGRPHLYGNPEWR